LSELPDLTKADGDIELLELIGRARGAKAAGGRVDFYKAAEVLIRDFRNGSIGGVCLENPDMIQQELIAVAELAAEKAEKKAAEKAARKQKHSGKRH
jgi:ribosome biogenesis GTPase A